MLAKLNDKYGLRLYSLMSKYKAMSEGSRILKDEYCFQSLRGLNLYLLNQTNHISANTSLLLGIHFCNIYQ